jgi:hypothetical protein
VAAAWTVRDSKGQLLPHFSARSRNEVARKVLRAHYDAFRLQVSSSYRQMFDRHLDNTLKREQWEIVSVRSRRTRRQPKLKLS